MPPSIAISLAWIGVLTGLMLAAAMLPLPKTARPVAIVVVVALIARALPLIVFRAPPGSFVIDIRNYALVADAVLAHHDPYAIDGPFGLYPHPYLPFQMYVFAAAARIAEVYHLPFFIGARLPQVVADAAIAALIVKIASRTLATPSQAFRYGLIYALCPLSVFITAYHGQFDAISVALALGAVYALIAGEVTVRSVAISAALLGFAILDKSWPLILLPVLLFHIAGLRERLLHAAISLAIPALATLVYVATFPGSLALIRQRISGYRAPEFDGQTAVLGHLANRFESLRPVLRWDVDHGGIVLAVALVITAVIVIPRRDLLTSCLAMTLAFLAATTIGGGNHQLWILPFALLAGSRWLLAAWLAVSLVTSLAVGYLACALFCGALVYSWGDSLLVNAWWLSIAQWLLVVVWLINIYVESLATPRLAPLATPSSRASRTAPAL